MHEKEVAFLKRAEAVEQRIDALLSQIELYKSLTQRVTASWGSEFTAHARNVGANENAIIRLTEARRVGKLDTGVSGMPLKKSQPS